MGAGHAFRSIPPPEHELLLDAPVDLERPDPSRLCKRRRDPQGFAKAKLGENVVGASDIVPLFDRLPTEAVDRSVIERRRGYLSGSGAYVHGGLCGVRRKTYEFPYAARVVCAFVTSVAPKTKATVYGKEALRSGLGSHDTVGSRSWEEELARMSLRGGNSPSTLAVPVRGNDSKLAAKERAAGKERSADQRGVQADMAAAREGGGADRARHLASKRTKVAVSALQRPRISRSRTVSRQR